ncbi:hypothetical protein FNV58_01230 (plasmid) [Streptomyces sp. RLB1-9]|uniref:hypothetical protein n=1 Tax=Streptomyces sp. RLB1-9 TaxID=2594454 RepID=UPI0011640BDF|nr:hypothetical protein [Streptomyces sp. RLB1-9]QDN94984.1 hypothetical protein FNV58_01230 [Streptomyces sp. RLB1-9]
MPTDRTTIHARVTELVDMLLDAATQTSPAAEQSTDTAPNMEESAEAAKRFFAPRTGTENVDYDAMTDEELLKSDVGTRVREILYRQLHTRGKEEYDKSQRRSAGAGIYGGVTRAADWVYPEDTWDGFRDAETWDPPYEPTDKARAELMERIAANDYKVERFQVEKWANDIAEANGWGEDEEAAQQDEAAEPQEWGIVQLSRRTQSPLRRATVHKAPCAALAKAVKAGTTRERTLGELWNVVIAGFYADGPEPGTDLTTVYTLCVQCRADQALQQAKGDDLKAWKNGARLRAAGR